MELEGAVIPKIKPQSLNGDTDIYGNRIAVGSRVRSFDFPEVIEEKVYGMDLEGPRACYLEGVVLAIGQVSREGCPRYTIQVTRTVRGGRPASNGPDTVYPPLNGTPKLFGGHCVGVVALGSKTLQPK